MIRGLPFLVLVACAGQLDEGFEASLTRGYACGRDYVVLTNGAETVRLVASFLSYAGEPSYEQASGVVTAQVEDDHVAVVTEGVVLPPERGGACEGDVAMSDGALTAVPLPGLVPR